MQTPSDPNQAPDCLSPGAIDLTPQAQHLQPGEHYAGVILDAHGHVQHHLVLLAAIPDTCLTWQAAMAWAESVGGSLPTRREQSLLFANCNDQFQPKWYWSCEQSSASGAWGQDFDNGYQTSNGKSAELRARAVRRFAA